MQLTALPYLLLIFLAVLVFVLAIAIYGLRFRQAPRELERRLAELETIHNISLASASQLELNALLEFVGENILRIFDAQGVYISLADQEHNSIRIPYWRRYGERIESSVPPSAMQSPARRGLTFAIIDSRQPILINQNYEPRAESYGVIHVSTADGKRPKSWLGVPILTANRIIGVLAIQNYERENVFTDVDVRLLTTLATNVGSAFQNAQHFDDARRRADQMTTLYDIGLTIASGLEMEQVLRNLLEQCRKALPIDVFYIAVYDAETGSVDHPLFYDLGEFRKSRAPRDVRTNPGLSGEVIMSRNTLYLPDALDPQAMQAHQILHAGGKPARSYVGVPMIVSERVVGVISMQSYRPNAYSADQIRLLETIAPQAAIAIENSRLYERAQREIAQRKQAQESLHHALDQMQAQLAEIQALQDRLREQATRDPLTNLFNRRYLEETLERELMHASRVKTSVSVVMIDIDRFKSFNDTYGHKAGDQMLQAIGSLLHAQTRGGDVACRYGGEEFVVVLPGATVEAARRRAENWRASFENLRLKYDDTELCSTISIGIAAYPKHGSTGEQVLHHADAALYAAKAAGCNCVRVWGEEVPII